MTEPRPSGSRHAVLAGFLGWTLDAFDFFVVIFLLDTLVHQFGDYCDAGGTAVVRGGRARA